MACCYSLNAAMLSIRLRQWLWIAYYGLQVVAAATAVYGVTGCCKVWTNWFGALYFPRCGRTTTATNPSGAFRAKWIVLQVIEQTSSPSVNHVVSVAMEACSKVPELIRLARTGPGRLKLFRRFRQVKNCLCHARHSRKTCV